MSLADELNWQSATELARLFLEEEDLGLAPSSLFLKAIGLDRAELLRRGPSSVGIDAAERAADRDAVVVEAYES